MLYCCRGFAAPGRRRGRVVLDPIREGSRGKTRGSASIAPAPVVPSSHPHALLGGCGQSRRVRGSAPRRTPGPPRSVHPARRCGQSQPGRGGGMNPTTARLLEQYRCLLHLAKTFRRPVYEVLQHSPGSGPSAVMMESSGLAPARPNSLPPRERVRRALEAVVTLRNDFAALRDSGRVFLTLSELAAEARAARAVARLATVGTLA